MIMFWNVEATKFHGDNCWYLLAFILMSNSHKYLHWWYLYWQANFPPFSSTMLWCLLKFGAIFNFVYPVITIQTVLTHLSALRYKKWFPVLFLSYVLICHVFAFISSLCLFSCLFTPHCVKSVNYSSHLSSQFCFALVFLCLPVPCARCVFLAFGSLFLSLFLVCTLLFGLYFCSGIS